MTDRQQALLNYVLTIRPHLVGAKSVNEIAERVLKCAREDLAFVGKGLLEGFVESGARVLEQKAGELAGAGAKALTDAARGFFAGLTKKKKRPF